MKVKIVRVRKKQIQIQDLETLCIWRTVSSGSELLRVPRPSNKYNMLEVTSGAGAPSTTNAAFADREPLEKRNVQKEHVYKAGLGLTRI